MPSSTSSSDTRSESNKYDRPLPDRLMRSGAVIGLFVMILMLGGWEGYWRSEDAVPSYRNSPGLWSIQRRRIDNGEGDKTVLTGSSRMLYNVQPDAWEQVSGARPIQLALEGTSPVGLMEDLAGDEDFTGTLIVGVAPGLFFSGFEYRGEAFNRYRAESPSQWLGQRISMLLEPFVAFYHPDYRLFWVIDFLPVPERDGVENFFDVRRLGTYEADRATRMWARVEDDPEYAAVIKRAWEHGFKPIDELDDEERQEKLEQRGKELERAIAVTRKLQDKGVETIFVRSPAEGHYATSEPMYNPREETWDVLIEQTGALGIHWMDHEELQGFWLPEWSHLSGSEADRFTLALYRIIEREKTAN